MEKNEGVKIISWRFAGVIIPWVTIFTMFLMAHEKYIKMQQVVEAFPKFVEAVGTLKQDVGILRTKVDVMSERMKEIADNLNRLESRQRWARRDD